MGGFPLWLTVVATTSLVVGLACAAVVLIDVVRHPQHMAVMNVVWPVTMLFGSVIWLIFYWRQGRQSPKAMAGERSERVAVAVGTSHCGAGCALGDLVGEFAMVGFPGLAVVFGLGSVFDDRIFAAWVLDFVLAYAFGIIFQYFSIKPMRNIGRGAALWAAVKADTLSITAWQVGMYGVMAIAQLAVFPLTLGHRASALSPEFWMVMQLAMIAGFATAFPVNRWLIRKGIKERM